ncbi:MAG: flagellar motor switch protein FliG [Lachnospiraceae bacterium]|nr:flagellar motor switch protein FliG [Clostridiales bacterium]MDY3109823.1 flagellar motor switch protein FliG [Lachnospiraceae bacterium]
MARVTEERITGLQKAAILLIALGPEKSASVFKHLKEDEIEELTLEIANTRSVTPQLKEDVINEFYQICLAQQYIAEGGISYAKELLEKSFGSDKARDVIGKLTSSLQVKPFEFVRKTDASQLLSFIQDEHPQTIALILSYLAPNQASMIISALPPDRQADVAKRIAIMDRTSPDVIKEVERVLESKLASLVNQDYTIIGGVDSVVEILNAVDRGTEKHIMETLEIEEPELADEIRKKMFVFEDILLLDDRSIQRVLREVDNNDLAIALKGSNEDVQNAIFNNLSKRLAVMIKEDMDFMGPVRMKDVEEAQQKIVNIIRKLEDSSEIVISRGGGDEIIV